MNTTERNILLTLLFGLFIVPVFGQWNQLGMDIDGQAAFNQIGYSVSLSADGTRVATGAPFHDVLKGTVQVHSWDGSNWNQLGMDIDGQANHDRNGWSVSLSADGKRVAMGAPRHDGLKGTVQVYAWDGSSWNQLGMDIDGQIDNDQNGYSVSLSADGTRVAMGAPGHDGKGTVQIYAWDGTGWNQLGLDIDGQAVGDDNGWSVSLSADGSRVVMGANGHDGLKGNVQIYAWDGTGWNQLGMDIVGQAANDYNGTSVSLSADGTRVAMGAHGHDGNGIGQIYRWNGSSWNQLGLDIDGQADGDLNGFSVSLSADGSRVAIGAIYHDGRKGTVQIYGWGGSSWSQLGADIDGQADGDRNGYSVSLSADGSRVALGAIYHDGNWGTVQIYEGLFTPVPTLSQWGLILLGLSLSIFGFVSISGSSPYCGNFDRNIKKDNCSIFN